MQSITPILFTLTRSGVSLLTGGLPLRVDAVYWNWRCLNAVHEWSWRGSTEG